MIQLLVFPVVKTDSNKLAVAYEVATDTETQFNGTAIWVPKFFQYDGASIPSALRPFIGSPFDPEFMVAAVFHDWLYHTHAVSQSGGRR